MKHIKGYRVFETEEPIIQTKHYKDGSFAKQWFLNGKMHREDGPAEIGYYPDGSVSYTSWYIDDEAHREEGPAWIEYNKDGSVRYEMWSLGGNSVTKETWVEKTHGLSAEELVEISTNDPDPEVRRAAKRNPKYPEDLEGWAINMDDWT